VCYLLQGNMAFGIYKDNLIVRLGSDADARKAIEAARPRLSTSPGGDEGLGHDPEGETQVPRAIQALAR